MKLKEGVDPTGIQPELLLAIMAAKEAYRDYGYDLVITSLTDGKHSRTSLHYSGCAVDLRTRHMGTEEDKAEIATLIKDSLGPDYDVILESTHIHIEWQPKRRD